MLASDEDRAVAVTQLKIAFVKDQLSVEELERRVELAHRSEQLRQLDEILVDPG